MARRKLTTVIADRGQDFTITVEADGYGSVHLDCEAWGGICAPMPRLTPEEARKLSSMLSEIAELAS